MSTAAGCSECSQTYRNGPDVAANANISFYVCSNQQPCTANHWGGTSFSAPMWAGYMALVNQQAIANGNSPVGFINPALYMIGADSSYDSAFHDITGGSNHYAATIGYDLATGWGSPNGSGLIDALAPVQGPSFVLTDNPNNLNITQGSNGTSTIMIIPSNGFNGNVALFAMGLPSHATGGFAPNPSNSASTLTITAGSSAMPGTYIVTISGVAGTNTEQTSLQLTVAGVPRVSLSPKSLTFSNEVVGEASAAKTISLTNTGTATLDIGSIVSSGDFAINSNTCSSTLAANKNCKIEVTFAPTQLGKRAGAITITDNAPDTPQTVALSGTGIEPAALTPASATYVKQAVGTTGLAKTFSLTNDGTVTLTSIVISTTGDFAVSATTCTTSLTAKGKCTISVTFTPTETGTRMGQLSVSDNANDSPQTSSLKGTGK
ncbi:MAG: choice-of-anchor D domain-containing protein [Terriglobales bacterium]